MTTGKLVACQAQSLPADGAAPDRIHLMPFGTFTGRDGRGPYTVRDKDHAAAIIATTTAHQGGTDLPVDYEHASFFRAPKGLPAPAAGWIKSLEVGPNGIWGKVEWTAHAAQQIADREYRYLSPMFAYSPKGDVGRIAGAGLVAMPNLDLVALSSQEIPTMNDETAARIRALLSLDDAADDATVIQAITNLVGLVVRLSGAAGPGAGNGAASDDSLCTASAAVHPQLAAMAQRFAATEGALHESTVREAIAAGMAAGKITPAMKDWAIETCSANPANFHALMKVMPPIVTFGQMLPNAMPPWADNESGLTSNQSAICRNLNLPADAFGKTR